MYFLMSGVSIGVFVNDLVLYHFKYRDFYHLGLNFGCCRICQTGFQVNTNSAVRKNKEGI